jgi:ribonuclease HI
MELTAGLEALKHLGAGSGPVEFFSDARYVVNGAVKWLPNWKKRGWQTSAGKTAANRSLWEELDRLLRGREVQWTWIRQGSTPEHLAVMGIAAAAIRSEMACVSGLCSAGTAHTSSLWRLPAVEKPTSGCWQGHALAMRLG